MDSRYLWGWKRYHSNRKWVPRFRKWSWRFGH